jgi:hypothetical protein
MSSHVFNIAGINQITDTTDVTKVWMINLTGATTGTKTTLTFNQTSNITLTIPTITDTIVARTTTDTLTNKTISGSANTLTNIPAGNLTGLIPNTVVNYARYYNNFNIQSLTNSLNTNMLFDSQDRDTFSPNLNSGLGGSPWSYLNIPAGAFQISACAGFNFNATGARSIAIYTGAAGANTNLWGYWQDDASTSANTVLSISLMVYTNASTTVSIVIFQASGGNLNTVTGYPYHVDVIQLVSY